MHIVMYQVIVVLILALITVVIIVGVRMDQAIANVRQALVDINATIAGLQPSTITATDVQGVADGIVAANQALKDKFPAV